MSFHRCSLLHYSCFWSPSHSALAVQCGQHGYWIHYNDVIMSKIASQITSISVVYSFVIRRRSKKTSKRAFVRGIHRWPVNSPHKGQWRGKCFHLMTSSCIQSWWADVTKIPPGITIQQKAIFTTYPVNASFKQIGRISVVVNFLQ